MMPVIIYSIYPTAIILHIFILILTVHQKCLLYNSN